MRSGVVALDAVVTVHHDVVGAGGGVLEGGRRPGPDEDPGDNSGGDTAPLDAAPDYTITKDDALATAQPGDTITYTITVDNVGNQDGTGVTVADSFPISVLTNVTASDGGVVDLLLGEINWNLGALAAGGSVTLTVTADVLDPVGAGIDDFTNTVSVTDDLSNGPDPTPADNTSSDTTPVFVSSTPSLDALKAVELLDGLVVGQGGNFACTGSFRLCDECSHRPNRFFFDGADFQLPIAVVHFALVLLGIGQIISFNGPRQVQKIVFHPPIFFFVPERPCTAGHVAGLDRVGNGGA